MGFALRPGVSFCDVSGRLVFLDVHADRYFALSPAHEQTFRQLLDLPDQAGRLAEGCPVPGLLVETDTPTALRPVTLHRVADASLLDDPNPSGRVFHLVGALAHIRRARHILRHGGLHHVLDDLARAKAAATPGSMPDPDRLRGMATAFEMTARLVRSHDQCLPRSIALARRCLAVGLPVDLVIGVKLRPFSAHCWVQAGSWLVNDHIDNVRSFTPVLTI